eukprot:12045981-Heterocapsa_arctica.AAC.1
MIRQGKAGEHEKGKNNNVKERSSKEKMRNKNKEKNQKPATTQDVKRGRYNGSQHIGRMVGEDKYYGASS